MSKRKPNENEGFYEFFKSTFKIEGEGGIFDGLNTFIIEDDEEDEDYNLIEDMMTNNKNYKYDNVPYNFTIPKKEIDDIINDPDFLTFSPESNSAITSKSQNKRKGIHFKKNSKNNKDNLIKENELISDLTEGRFTKNTHSTHNNNFDNNYTNNINTNMNRIQPSKPLNIDFIELVRFFVKQYDIYLQLLIQNFLLCNDPKTKMRAYVLIYNFYVERTKVINTFNIPHFDVSFGFCRIFNEGKKIPLYPQISLFQAPIFEILPLIIPLSKKTLNKNQVCVLLKEFAPFINYIYLPVNLKLCKNKLMINDVIYESPENNIEINNIDIQQSTKQDNFLGKKKKKFGFLHDYLLMLGLLNHGKKNIDIIQKFWLDSRTVQEIKHRLKNLTCLKAQENIVKKLKTKIDSFLSKDEFYLFIKGMQWFGVKKKWNAISRYFLPKRNGDYLEEVFNLLVENNLLNFDSLDKSKKKKILKSLNKLKGDDVLKKYAQDFKNELSQTPSEIMNLESKDYFTTLEKKFDKIELEDETSDSEVEKQMKRKPLGIDIHIKNSKKFSYEQIILDN